MLPIPGRFEVFILRFFRRECTANRVPVMAVVVNVMMQKGRLEMTRCCKRRNGKVMMVEIRHFVSVSANQKIKDMICKYHGFLWVAMTGKFKMILVSTVTPNKKYFQRVEISLNEDFVVINHFL